MRAGVALASGQERNENVRAERGTVVNGYNLAELNIGRLLAPTDDPRVAEFGWKYLTDASLRNRRDYPQVAAE